jgi:hypothetical protein
MKNPFRAIEFSRAFTDADLAVSIIGSALGRRSRSNGCDRGVEARKAEEEKREKKLTSVCDIIQLVHRS